MALFQASRLSANPTFIVCIMPNNAVARPKVLLLGLEDSLAKELAGALRMNQREFRSAPSFDFDDSLEGASFSVIFCSADPRQYLSLLEFIRRLQLQLPIIVVSRQPDSSEWLDALEAGAADYCSPPFKPVQIRWLLDNTLRGQGSSVA